MNSTNGNSTNTSNNNIKSNSSNKSVVDHLKSIDNYGNEDIQQLLSKYNKIDRNVPDKIIHDKLFPLILKCIQGISKRINNDSTFPFKLIMKGGTLIKRYGNKNSVINDLDCKIIPKVTTNNNSIKKIPDNISNITSILKFYEKFYSAISVKMFINYIYAMCMYLNLESLKFTDELKDISVQLGNMFRVRPYFIKKYGVFLLALDIVSVDQKTSLPIVDFVFDTQNSYKDDDIILDSGILIETFDSFLKNQLNSGIYASTEDKRLKRFVRVLKLKSKKSSAVDVYDDIIRSYTTSLKFDVYNYDNFIKDTGLCTIINYTSYQKKDPDLISYLFNFLSPKAKDITYDNYVCFVKSAKVFGINQYGCTLESKYQKLGKAKVCTTIQSASIKKFIKDKKLFETLVRVGVTGNNASNASLIESWQSSDVKPVLVGGKAMLFSVLAKGKKPTILKSYLYNTYDYDVHVYVKTPGQINECEDIIKNFIEDFSKSRRYFIKYNRSTKSSRSFSSVGSGVIYITHTYILQKRYNNYDTVVLDITYIKGDTKVKIDKGVSKEYQIPIKEPKYYLRDILKTINRYLKGGENLIKYKKSLVRAYYLLDQVSPNKTTKKLRSICEEYGFYNGKLNKKFWNVFNAPNYIKNNIIRK